VRQKRMLHGELIISRLDHRQATLTNLLEGIY
jgi:hypothetical protein